METSAYVPGERGGDAGHLLGAVLLLVLGHKGLVVQGNFPIYPVRL